MTAILLRNDLLPLNEAIERLPGRPHRTTIRRWVTKGYPLPDGSRVYLRVVRLGKRVLLAPEDVQAFSEAVTEAHHQQVESDKTQA